MKLTILVSLYVLSCLNCFSQVQINGSYLNVTRPTGGPVSTGDIIELRAVISISSGTNIGNLFFTDNVPAGTSYVSGSLKVVTNENKIIAAIPNTGNYTDAAGDDRAQIAGAAILIFMGTGATKVTGGTINGGSTTPLFYNVATIMMATYRVQVTASNGTTITTAGLYHWSIGSTNYTANVPATSIVVSPYYGCGSSAGTNYITTETNGTFGSGTSQNRSTSSSSVSGFTFTNLNASAPVDGQYSIAKNTSPTQYTGSSPASGDKVYGVWDVMGDHTGTSTGAGNSPAASGATGGYLLAVNATFTPATIFSTSVTGLTANSIYTISLWVRNICPSCANDPATGTSLTTAGVSPNLAINLNGKNYYSSGDITYTGQWVQKSFTFQNGASTTATFDIKNNSPGGGGNDWVLDDITMTQCLIVLPLGLQSFSGHHSPQGAVLDWQLNPSPELRSFIIERSTDGSHFLSIGEQAAIPDSARYQFTDALLSSTGSTLYYRIQLVSIDGTTNYSNIVVLRSGNDAGTLTTHLTPNPARTSTTLVISSARPGSAQITCWSPAGAPVFSRGVTVSAGTNAVALSLPAYLPAGIYILKTTTGSESAISRLIIE
jgi:uncharacterized repeat protein (TIGR01451 family)